MFRADPLSVRVRPDFFPLSPDQFRDQEATRAAKAIRQQHRYRQVTSQQHMEHTGHQPAAQV